MMRSSLSSFQNMDLEALSQVGGGASIVDLEQVSGGSWAGFLGVSWG